MADETEKVEEKKIPVFTVLKKGSIIKNIYLDDPLISGEDDSVLVGVEEKDEEEEEEIFIVGRHPDCNIMLEHPSISRFHLKILSKPSSKSLSVMDLSSAHGTWISDQKIEPQVTVDLNEGDTLRLGASTRVYRLHWVPRTFDREISPNFENPFSIQEEEEVEEGGEKINEMEHDLSFEREENHTLSAALPMSENRSSSFVIDDDNGVAREEVSKSPLWSRAMGEESVYSSSTLAAVESFVLETSLQQSDKENGIPQSLVDASNVLSDIENQARLMMNTPNIWSRRGKSVGSIQIEIAKSSVKKVEGSTKQEKEEDVTPDKDNCTPRPALGMRLMRKEVGSYAVRNTGSFASKVRSRMKNMEVNSSNVSEEEIVSRVLFPGAANDGEELYTPEKENSAPRSLLGLKTKNKGILEEMKNENSGSLRSKVSSIYPNIDEDREAEELFTPDKDNITPGHVLGTKLKKKGCLQVVKNQSSGSLGSKASMYSNILQEEYRKCEEVFTPDKENFSPRPILGMDSMENGGLEEMQNFESPNSKFITTPNSDVEEGRFYFSDKENSTPVVSRDSKSMKSSFRDHVRNDTEMILSKREEGSVLFQSLLSPNSISKKSEFSAPYIIATKSCDSANFSQSTEKNCASFPTNQSGEEANNRRWNMVVDTGSLLDKDSWKSIKLLEGIKGTHLIIPRMVIRELDSLKRRGSLFKRAAEVSSSSVLDWIEECMIKTNGWIHVQNSIEESLPIAPTPPASPQSILRDMSHDAFGRALHLSSFGSLMEIASPTAQDHTLECALLFKRIKNNERLVLLSNDVALKIKAMAEGLICESAEEFRGSLVNPYSERFMWAGSTPRGPTWSSFIDASVLREKCYQDFPLKKTKSAEGAKGLKLILLHNSSHYGKITTSTVN